jgi:hypothetical protein
VSLAEPLAAHQKHSFQFSRQQLAAGCAWDPNITEPVSSGSGAADPPGIAPAEPTHAQRGKNTPWRQLQQQGQQGIGQSLVLRHKRIRGPIPQAPAQQIETGIDQKINKNSLEFYPIYNNSNLGCLTRRPVALGRPMPPLVLGENEVQQLHDRDSTQPLLPMGLGHREGVTHGTNTLFAALDVATGDVITQCHPPPAAGMPGVPQADREVGSRGLGHPLDRGQLLHQQERQGPWLAGDAAVLPRARQALVCLPAQPSGALVWDHHAAGDPARQLLQRLAEGFCEAVGADRQNRAVRRCLQ